MTFRLPTTSIKVLASFIYQIYSFCPCTTINKQQINNFFKCDLRKDTVVALRTLGYPKPTNASASGIYHYVILRLTFV